MYLLTYLILLLISIPFAVPLAVMTVKITLDPYDPRSIILAKNMKMVATGIVSMLIVVWCIYLRGI